MNTAAFFHKANDNYCYPFNANQLMIRVKTGFDVTQVFLVYGDPFQSGILGGCEQWTGTRVEITDCLILKEHKLFSILVEPPYKRCRYFFEMKQGEETVYLAESGVLTEEEYDNGRGRRLDFYFPWMNQADIYTPPQWVTDTIWYQIFPDRFCNGDPSNDPKDVKEWAGPDTPVRNEEIYGGDLAGIEKRLTYLKDLGIGGIYLTPINESRSIHKYDTDNYYKVDSQFGTNEDMKKLVKAAHEKNIRVMVDGVFNHCGVGFSQWQDVMEKGPQSPYFDWFMINQWPLSPEHENAREGRYYTFAFVDSMPKLNTNNPNVIDELLKVCTYWLLEYDIDALRLDVANEISHAFCKALRKQMLSLKPDFYIVGEIWHDSITWLRGDEFDSVMNYPLRDMINDLCVSPLMNQIRFQQEINRCYTMYMKQTNQVLFNLLDSHDTIRLFTQLGDEDLFFLQLAVLFTMTGSCCIYYGTEIGLEGGHDPDCRRCMPWEGIEDGQYSRRMERIKDLISMRKRYPALRYGDCRFPSHSYGENVYLWEKILDGDAVQILVNGGDAPISPQNMGGDGKVVYEALWDGKLLLPKGILIRTILECGTDPS